MNIEEVKNVLNENNISYYYQKLYMAGWDFSRGIFSITNDLLYAPLSKDQSVSLYFDSETGNYKGSNTFNFKYEPVFIQKVECVKTKIQPEYHVGRKNSHISNELMSALHIKKIESDQKYNIMNLIKGHTLYNSKEVYPPKIVIVKMTNGFMAYGEPNEICANMEFDRSGTYYQGHVSLDVMYKDIYPYAELIPNGKAEYESEYHVLNTMLELIESVM
jgi:hypothetical protein